MDYWKFDIITLENNWKKGGPSNEHEIQGIILRLYFIYLSKMAIWNMSFYASVILAMLTHRTLSKQLWPKQIYKDKQEF